MQACCDVLNRPCKLLPLTSAVRSVRRFLLLSRESARRHPISPAKNGQCGRETLQPRSEQAQRFEQLYRRYSNGR